jgi:hypothetical protein
MFVLVEQCDDAYWRIRGIARNASEGRLGDTDNRLFIKGPERIDGRGRRDERIDDYFISTIYRLLAPCVTFQICQERLTSTDLSADEYVARIYWLARLLRRTWNSADEIARIETGERLNKTDAKRAHREQVNLRDVDLLVEYLRSPDGRPCVRTFSEVCHLYAAADPALIGRLEPFRRAFQDFHPDRKPLLWRVLLAQAIICAALKNASRQGSSTSGASVVSGFIASLPPDLFDWRATGACKASPTVTNAIDVAYKYVQQEFKRHGPAAPDAGIPRIQTPKQTWIERNGRRRPEADDALDRTGPGG